MQVDVPALERRARTVLEGTANHEVTTLVHRIHRWGPDLLDGLEVYRGSGQTRDPVGPDLAERVVDLLASAFTRRRPALRTLDDQRVLRPDWFAGPDQVGYVCYADRFGGTLTGVRDRIGYLRELGVTYLHLMPVLQPRQGPDDGGYAVADYRKVRSDLGTMDDLADLADALHENGIALTLDLVLNHVAKEHPWARAAAHGHAPYRDYFHTYPDRTLPDAYERSLPEVFPDFAPGSFTWEPDVVVPGAAQPGAWVWTTFNGYQWDLDWSNPDVFVEMLDVILTLAGVGVDCLRLDAIAFIWKRMGTTCQNQPEVHDIVQALRAAARIAAPALVFKAEAIVSPEDLPAYLGSGLRAGKVCDLAYNNSLMVQLWSALATADTRLTRRALAVPPPKPVTTAWGTYVRCHDDIGWAVSDSDAAATGLSGFGHRAFLSRFYSGDFPGSFARGVVFQANPVTLDARISGTLASLAGLEVALQEGDDDRVNLSLGRIFLLHAVAYGYGGIPLLYMGDEIALLNDNAYLDDARLADDNRWLHRPFMPWARAALRSDPSTVEGRVFSGLAHLARVRASLPSLHAGVESVPIDAGNDAVLGLLRRHPGGTMVQLYNMSAGWQQVPVGAVAATGLAEPFEHLSSFAPVEDWGVYSMPPYAAWWLAPRDARYPRH